MKHLLIALIALAITLGVGCKKSNDVVDSKPAKEVKKEIASAYLKLSVLALENPGGGGIGGYPGGSDTYPHNTGLCYCGAYSVCHPVQHNSSCPAALGTGGCTGCPKSSN